MNILFFIVHPAKFHMLRPTVSALQNRGDRVDFVIISKDVLPELLERSGLTYTNIFPTDRRSRSTIRIVKTLQTLLSAFKTAWRLWRYVRRQDCRYDLFVTDDCLSVVGKLMNIPVLFILDTDFDVVPEFAPLLKCSTAVFAPKAARMHQFASKKIAFSGYKECCYLTPKYFKPRPEVLRQYGLEYRGYAFIRVVAQLATHDFGKSGLSSDQLEKLIDTIQRYGLRPLLCMEQKDAGRFSSFLFNGNPMDVPQLLAHAAVCFGDSQTMNTEAVVLGVPCICCNDFCGRIGVTEEQEKVYGMTYSFLTRDFDKALDKLEELLRMPDLHEQWERKRQQMLLSMEDVTEHLIDVIVNKKLKKG